MLQWVEKASLKKIRSLLEVSEHERHYEVLLTLKNLADVRRSPAPHSLLIIPRALPVEIVDGEHFVTSNLLCLLAGRAPSTRDLEAKHHIGNKRQGLRLFRRPLPTGIPS